ncbi:MAG: ROK family protein [Planctomycetota bacterium]
MEAGGTKFVCAVGTGPETIVDETRFPTTTPDETIGKAVAFFRSVATGNDLAGIGIGSFGPVDPNPASATYGYITATPKPGWSDTDFAGRIKSELGVPVRLDTDVNAAALGEQRWGAARGLQDFIYLTVGTGIGGGGMLGGNLMHGLVHPEMGHIRLPHDHQRDPFEGSCPFHGDCLEGLASGFAMQQRWGVRAETLAPDHEAWPLEADYLAAALNNYICTLSPERIIMGGGIMQQEQLFGMVRSRVQVLLGGYVKSPSILEDIDSYIVPPGLGNRAGVLGSMALTMD